MFTNREALASSHGRELALDCIQAGIEAGDPRTVIRESISVTEETLIVDDTQYDLTGVDDVVVVGGGNAAGLVVEALEDELGERLSHGAVVTDSSATTDRVELLPGDHPIPSERGMQNTRRVTKIARDTAADDLVLAVITGGGSALLETPMADIDLSDVQRTTEELLESGAPIHEINAIRKHLSAVKGGRLARAIAPSRTVGLVFSDVVGNDLDVVASGPIAPDESTFEDALRVIETNDVTVPSAVRSHLEKGVAGEIEETPDGDDPVFDQVSNHVLADGVTAIEAAEVVAREHGYEPLILSSRIRGEAREAAKTHIAIAEEIDANGCPVEPPAVVLSGGETTVTVSGEGRGGPNQEFAVSSSYELDNLNVVVASVDTDGYDGSTDVAGAIVNADTLDPDVARAALETNDSYEALDEVNAHLRTGATGTNVNDLRVVVIESRTE